MSILDGTTALVKLLPPEQKQKLLDIGAALLGGREQQIVVLRVLIPPGKGTKEKFCFLAVYQWSETSVPEMFFGNTPEEALGNAIAGGCRLVVATPIVL